MKKKLLAMLICVAMLLVGIAGTAMAWKNPDYEWDEKQVQNDQNNDGVWDEKDAQAIYDKNGTYNHLDIRVAGTLTTKSYVNGELKESETKAVTVSNPSVVVMNGDTEVYDLDTEDSATYEWRWTKDIVMKNSYTVILTCDITIDGVTKENQTFTFTGKDDFVQAILVCDGHEGLDFIVSEEDIAETFYYGVKYEWTGLPAALAVEPTDDADYKANEIVTVDTEWTVGETREDDKYVYTFSGWTSYQPEGGKVTELTEATFKITADTTVYGEWEVTEKEKETPTPTTTTEPTTTETPTTTTEPTTPETPTTTAEPTTTEPTTTTTTVTTTEPTTTTTEATTTEAEDDDVIKTGDETNMVLWLAVMAVAAVGAVAAVAANRKRSADEV